MLTMNPIPTSERPEWCSCGRRGEYTGCAPTGTNAGPLRVAFKCGCGRVWNFLIPRADLGKYRT